MKPGKELDTLIAENVMGETRIIREWPDGSIHQSEYRPYSTDIAAAWLVVEEMTKRASEGSGVSLICRITSNGLRTEAAFLDPFAGSPADPGNWPNFVAEAETAPHAICLAALKALGVELE